MTAVAFIRLASALALLQGLGHAAAVIRWTPSRGSAESAVVHAMKTHAFAFQGFNRTYWDLFVGYGLFAAFNCLIEAAILWQLAGGTPVTKGGMNAIVAVMLFANLVYAAACWRYFFFTPLAFDLAIALCLALALAAPAAASVVTRP